jgi:hypothetical protein
MTDKEIADRISRGIRDGSTLARILDRLVDDDMLRPWLQQILKEGSVASQNISGYQHPNGFLKIRLLSITGSWSLRAHVWESFDGDKDVHNHRWDFASRILIGGLRERLYHVSEFGAGDRRLCDCSKAEDGKTYTYHDRGRCTIVCHSETEYRQGETYMLRYSVLHDASPSDNGPLMTLFLQGHDQMKVTTVISPGEAAGPKKLTSARLTNPGLEDALWQVVEHLPT